MVWRNACYKNVMQDVPAHNGSDVDVVERDVIDDTAPREPLTEYYHHLPSIELQEEREEKATQIFKMCLTPQTLEVCAVTIANGGENVSVNLPLFACDSTSDNIVTIVIFYGMLCACIGVTYRDDSK